MPLYVIECPTCGHRDTVFRSVEQRNDDLPNHCNATMHRVILPSVVRGDITPYQSPIDGRAINSRRQRTEDLKRNHCRPWEGIDAEKAHAASCKASEDAKFEAGIASKAAEVLNNLPTATQNVLKGAL